MGKKGGKQINLSLDGLDVDSFWRWKASAAKCHMTLKQFVIMALSKAAEEVEAKGTISQIGHSSHRLLK